MDTFFFETDFRDNLSSAIRFMVYKRVLTEKNATETPTHDGLI